MVDHHFGYIIKLEKKKKKAFEILFFPSVSSTNFAIVLLKFAQVLILKNE